MGQQVAITLTSTAFDSFLYLLAPDGSILVADDDGAGGTDSRIPAAKRLLHACRRTGTYTMEATSFSPGRTGNYSLSLTTGQANCTYNISPSAQNFSSVGGGGTVNVTAAAGCNWSASSNAGFLTITGGASGSGNGNVSYTVTSNPEVLGRSGTLTIAGQTFTVIQSAGQVPTPTPRQLRQPRRHQLQIPISGQSHLFRRYPKSQIQLLSTALLSLATPARQSSKSTVSI